MPYTPYHLGPSGFIGLTFRKWLDVPVFVLANVIVDLEVLIITQLGFTYPIHRFTHTLLIGSAAGIIWAMAAWPFRNIFKRLMQILRIPYQTSFWKMLVSGVLGVWLHVVIDQTAGGSNMSCFLACSNYSVRDSGAVIFDTKEIKKSCNYNGKD